MEVDRRQVSELTAARVITGRFNGAFCNFLCTKKMFQNDLNECIFVYVHGNEAIQKREQGRVCWIRWERCCVWRPSVSFLFVCSYFYFFTEPFTS